MDEQCCRERVLPGLDDLSSLDTGDCRVESIPSILISIPSSLFLLDVGFFLVCAGAKTTFLLLLSFPFIIPSIDLFPFVYSFLKIC